MSDFTELLGKTLTCIERDGDESLTFHCSDGATYRQWHCQDCCESVEISEIVGDLDDMIGAPLLEADEANNSGEGGDAESWTWTFYKLGTIKGHVTIRWFGSSNGYYSESVSFDEVEPARLPSASGRRALDAAEKQGVR